MDFGHPLLGRVAVKSQPPRLHDRGQVGHIANHSGAPLALAVAAGGAPALAAVLRRATAAPAPPPAAAPAPAPTAAPATPPADVGTRRRRRGGLRLDGARVLLPLGTPSARALSPLGALSAALNALEGGPIEGLAVDVVPARHLRGPLRPLVPGAVGPDVVRDVVLDRHARVPPRRVRALVRRAVHHRQLLRLLEVALARDEKGRLVDDLGVVGAEDVEVAEGDGVLREPSAHHQRVVVRGGRQPQLEQLEGGRAPRRLVGIAHDERRVAEYRMGRDEEVDAAAAAELDEVGGHVAVGVLVVRVL